MEIEEQLESKKANAEVEILLDTMLRFLAEMPVDEHHDYRTFRHTGLRGYLINRFLREKWNEELSRSARAQIIKIH
jgi:hypothetical protein